MATDPDIFARLLGVGSLIAAGYAVWLNLRKDRRDLAALRPKVSVRASPQNPNTIDPNGYVRQWNMEVTVQNTFGVPITWRRTEAAWPIGLVICSTDGFAGTPSAFDHRYFDEKVTDIGPNETKKRTFSGRIHGRFGVSPNAIPVLEPIFDGMKRESNLLLAIWRRISIRAMRM